MRFCCSFTVVAMAGQEWIGANSSQPLWIPGKDRLCAWRNQFHYAVDRSSIAPTHITNHRVVALYWFDTIFQRVFFFFVFWHHKPAPRISIRLNWNLLPCLVLNRITYENVQQIFIWYSGGGIGFWALLIASDHCDRLDGDWMIGWAAAGSQSQPSHEAQPTNQLFLACN